MEEQVCFSLSRVRGILGISKIEVGVFREFWKYVGERAYFRKEGLRLQKTLTPGNTRLLSVSVSFSLSLSSASPPWIPSATLKSCRDFSR